MPYALLLMYKEDNMTKAIAILMLILSLGVVGVSANNADYDFTSPSFNISADDDTKKDVDPAPNTSDDLLSIETNKGME